MQRRKFIMLSAVAGTAAAFAGIQCNRRPSAIFSILEKPEFLSQICDVPTIREIGMAYRLQKPKEQTSDELADLLLKDNSGEPFSSTADVQLIRKTIGEKIKLDFEKSDTIVVSGWILAVTEARQCALFAAQHQ
jgi:hypothetical protein